MSDRIQNSYEFEPRQGRGRMVALGFAVLAIAIVAGYFLINSCGGESCEGYYCTSGQDADAPEGFRFVADLYEFNDGEEAPPGGSQLEISLPLNEDGVESRGLTFYSFNPPDGTWQSQGPAVLNEDGDRAEGTLSSVPAFLTVLQRVTPAGQVIAYLGPGATLHPDATGNVTIVHTADFRPGADGSLTGDPSPVARDGSFQFLPMIVADGSPEGGLATVTSLLTTPETRTQHVRAIVDRVKSAGLDGIDIAYFDLPADQRITYTLFVTELAQALHGEGKMLTLTLQPPVRTATGDYDEGAYDWAELGVHADLIQIRPYRDQATYRIVVPSLLEHLTTRVEPSRLILMVTPYATEKGAGAGEESIRSMTIVEAMTIASTLAIRAGGGAVQTESIYEVAAVNIDKEEGRSGLAWSPETATVSFTYEFEGGRTVFLENVFSVGFKLDYVGRYQLGGVAVEDASNNVMLGNIWPALATFASTGEPLLLQPNSVDLAPRWFATAGTLDGGQRGVVTWTTPTAPGQHAIRVTLSDGVALFENELPVSVVLREPTTTSIRPGP